MSRRGMKSFFYGLIRSFSWTVSLGSKVFRVAPFQTLGSVVATLFSQFFLLAGFLLPLKVVLLLGSTHVPKYFPIVLQAIGRDQLILSLSVASVVLYFFHLMTARVADYLSLLGAHSLLAKSNKISIFENQEEIALRGYQRYSQSLASFCFWALCVLVMLVFYPKLAVVIGGYFFLVLTLIGVLFSTVKGFEFKYSESLGGLPKVIASLGFLSSFAFIVFDFLFGHSPGVLIAVISLLLARQLFARVASLIKDQFDLYRQKGQLSALFFHGAHYHDHSKPKPRGIWSILEPDLKRQWVCEVLSDIVQLHASGISIHLVQSGQPDILCYLIRLNDGDGAGRQFLVKVFNVNRSSWAKHEATLLFSSTKIPSLPFISATTVGGMNCHIFEATGYRCCSATETAKAQMEFRALLSTFSPSADLTSSYIRSRTRSWQRLDDELLYRLEWLLGDDADPLLFSSFRSRLQSIRRTLEAMPHCIFVQDVRPGVLWVNDHGDFALSNWGRWELEPLGVRWVFTAKEADRNAAFVEFIQERRDLVNALNIRALEFSSLVYDFGFFIQRARYLEAYALMGKMLEIIDEL